MKIVTTENGFKLAAVLCLLPTAWGINEWLLEGSKLWLPRIIAIGGALGSIYFATRAWPEIMMMVTVVAFAMGMLCYVGGAILWYHCLLLDWMSGGNSYTHFCSMLTTAGIVLLVASAVLMAAHAGQ